MRMLITLALLYDNPELYTIDNDCTILYEDNNACVSGVQADFMKSD